MEQQPLHEERKGHEDGEVEHDTLDNVVAGALYVGISARLIAPRRPSQLQSLVILLSAQQHLRFCQVDIRHFMEPVQTVVAYSIAFVQVASTLIQRPHVSHNNVWRDSYRAILPDDETLTCIQCGVLFRFLVS